MSDDIEEIIIEKDEDDTEGSTVKPEWKKKKVEDDERLTLRIDALEADRWQAKRNKMQPDIKRTKTGKISKKVRQLYDDDENEEDDFDEDIERSFRELRRTQAEASNGDTTLLDALAPSERLMIEQRTHQHTVRQQENAGKLNAIEQADRLARRAGLEQSKIADDTKHLNEAIYNPRRLRAQALEGSIVKQTGIKGEVKLNTETKVADGVKQVQKTTENRKAPDVKVEDAKMVSKRGMSKNETAEMILRKSGQTSKLAEIKKQNLTDINKPQMPQKETQQEFETSVAEQKNQKQQNNTKGYQQQVKGLLQDTLRKNGSSRQ